MSTRKRLLIDPIKAQELLDKHNKQNRRVKPDTVNQYASDMKRGRWKSGYDPIVVNKDGILENGQHRLLAVIRSGVPTIFEVITDAEPAMESYDRGVPRTIADAITIYSNRDKLDIKNIVHKTAIIRFLFREGLGIDKVSDNTIYEFIKEHDENLEKAVTFTSQGSPKLSRKAPISVVCFIALEIGYSEDALREFFYIVNTGFPNKPDQTAPILLRNEILENKYTGRIERTSLELCTELAIKDFISNKTRKRKYNLCNAKPELLLDYMDTEKEKYKDIING